MKSTQEWHNYFWSDTTKPFIVFVKQVQDDARAELLEKLERYEKALQHYAITTTGEVAREALKGKP